MTSPADNTPESVGNFMQLWVESLTTVLAQIASVPFPLERSASPREPIGPSPQDVHLVATVAGAARGELFLRVPQASAAALAKIFTGEEGAAGDLNAQVPAALEEFFRQVAGHIVTSAASAGRDFSLTVALSERPTWSPASQGWLESASGAPVSIAIEWQMSAALSTSLASSGTQKTEASTTRNRNERQIPTAGPVDLFMDLELDVTLRFGGRNVLLKEILELGPGSVLQLDREVHDAADLLLDGKLIARGEVVMVNGNFGLRVTETLTAPQVP